MSDILSLFEYHRVNPTTWVYLSSLLTIGLFFKFNRFWSVRNLDLAVLMLLGPGLLMANFGLQMKAAASAKIKAEKLAQEERPPGSELEAPLPTPLDSQEPPEGESIEVPTDASSIPESPPADSPAEEEGGPPATAADPAQPQDGGTDGEESEAVAVVASPGEQEYERAEYVEEVGYVWLFVVAAILLIRLLADPTMVRRPLLEPNLTVGGMTFSCCALFMFLMANVITSTAIANEDPSKFGPGHRLLYAIPAVPVTRLAQDDAAAETSAAQPEEEGDVAFGVTAKVMAILAQLAIVVGIVMIGYRHFDNIRTGIGAATLYLLLPYTAQMTGRVDHVLPAALLVWAIYFYRRPLTAGIFLGLAGVVYYPLFLLPLWMSFYWQRGKTRFLVGFAIAICGLVLALFIRMWWLVKLDDFGDALIGTFALHLPVVRGLDVGGLAGFWNYYEPIYRLPLLAAFGVLSLSFALWPAQKNLGTLMCCTAAVMVAAQFWHRYNGGTFMAWYLPLLLLTIFRPNLEDRVAAAVLGEGWFPRRRAAAQPVDQAA
jgi:hypothetical protein